MIKVKLNISFRKVILIDNWSLIWVKKTETEQSPVGPPKYKFCVRHFLFVGNRLHSASFTVPEFQRADSNIANQGRQEMQKQRSIKKQ